ncbi:MAG: TIGR03756 family integrating conjugative element protein [Gammaproteobacteria bacterium]|nr:TIGR03756 family integrating conjugative element protein [Gammaproteobacteria bacterium]
MEETRALAHTIRPNLLFFLCTLAISVHVDAREIDTLQVTSTTAEAMAKCLKWKVVGSCYWLNCGLDGCSIKVSLKVAHYRPDSIVSVYPNLRSHPWKEVKVLVDQAVKAALPNLDKSIRHWIQGNGTEPSPELQSSTRNLRYFESDLMGHPLVDIVFPGADYICDSATRPLTPYYISLLDLLAWRNPLVENLNRASVVPGLREVGRWPVNTWGPVYPRSGWIQQSSPPKAAAVIAQRTADIVINGGNLRIRKRFRGGRAGFWPPYRIRENNSSTAKWQMLHPVKEKQCSVFGQNDLPRRADWGGGKVDTRNTYMWSLWRPYKCCPRRGQVYLGSDDVHGYP